VKRAVQTANKTARPEAATRPRYSAKTRLIQRIATHESPREEDANVIPEEERSAVQRKQSDGGYFAPRYASDGFSRRLDARAGAGEPLDARLRAAHEPWFGDSVERVRIHRDAEAGDMSRSISARAFATGRDIYFAPGEYRPDSMEGRRVLAHELAHVVQQSAGRGEGELRRMSAPTRRTATNVAQWSLRITGDDYDVETDGGNTVGAWIAYSPWQIQYHYWCHGHSLGTFDRFGYSVYSGGPMRRVVADEWSPVASGATRAGDIAVWLPSYGHSCRIVAPAFTSGALDPAGTQVTSKNGGNPLASTTLASVMGSYASAGSPAIFRRR
jgi:hypothetical protein